MIQSLLINLISGAVGGNLAGSILKDFNAGWLTKSIAGIVGGGIGGQIISQLGIDPAALASGSVGGFDIGSILSQVGGGGVGGGLALIVWSYVKKMIA